MKGLMVILILGMVVGQANAEPERERKIVSRLAGPRPEVVPFSERPPESLCPAIEGAEKIACLARLLVAVSKAADDAANQNAADIDWIVSWTHALELEVEKVAHGGQANPADVTALREVINEVKNELEQLAVHLYMVGQLGFAGINELGAAPVGRIGLELVFSKRQVLLRGGGVFGADLMHQSGVGTVYGGDAGLGLQLAGSGLYLLMGGSWLTRQHADGVYGAQVTTVTLNLGFGLRLAWFTVDVLGMIGHGDVGGVVTPSGVIVTPQQDKVVGGVTIVLGGGLPLN